MNNKITLELEGLAATELCQELNNLLPEIKSTLEANEQTFRGQILSDPQVVTAIISSGSVIISAILAAYSTIHSARLANKEASVPAQINIYTSNDTVEPKMKIQVENIEQATSQELMEHYPELEELSSRISRIQYVRR